MAERLILVKIPGPEKVSQITRVLTQIPNLTSGVIQNQLKALPFLLPQLDDYNLQNNIKERLEKMGCNVVVKYIEGKKENRGPVKKFSPEIKPKLSESKPVEIVRRKYTPPPEKEDSISTSNIRPKKRNIREWTLFGGLLVLLGLIYWMSILSSDSRKKDNSSSQSSVYERPPLSQNNSAEQKTRSEEGHSVAEHPYTQKLESQIEQNPYDSEAWNKLIRHHRETGNAKEARRLSRESWEKNEKVRAVLKSIALKFGTPALPMELNKETFKLDLHVTDELRPYDRSHGIYGELQPEFGDKRLQVLFRHKDGDVYELDVPPAKGGMDENRIRLFVHKREN